MDEVFDDAPELAADPPPAQAEPATPRRRRRTKQPGDPQPDGKPAPARSAPTKPQLKLEKPVPIPPPGPTRRIPGKPDPEPPVGAALRVIRAQQAAAEAQQDGYSSSGDATRQPRSVRRRAKRENASRREATGSSRHIKTLTPMQPSQYLEPVYEAVQVDSLGRPLRAFDPKPPSDYPVGLLPTAEEAAAAEADAARVDKDEDERIRRQMLRMAGRTGEDAAADADLEDLAHEDGKQQERAIRKRKRKTTVATSTGAAPAAAGAAADGNPKPAKRRCLIPPNRPELMVHPVPPSQRAALTPRRADGSPAGPAPEFMATASLAKSMLAAMYGPEAGTPSAGQTLNLIQLERQLQAATTDPVYDQAVWPTGEVAEQMRASTIMISREIFIKSLRARVPRTDESACAHGELCQGVLMAQRGRVPDGVKPEPLVAFPTMDVRDELIRSLDGYPMAIRALCEPRQRICLLCHMTEAAALLYSRQASGEPVSHNATAGIYEVSIRAGEFAVKQMVHTTWKKRFLGALGHRLDPRSTDFQYAPRKAMTSMGEVQLYAFEYLPPPPSADEVLLAKKLGFQ